MTGGQKLPLDLVHPFYGYTIIHGKEITSKKFIDEKSNSPCVTI